MTRFAVFTFAGLLAYHSTAQDFPQIYNTEAEGSAPMPAPEAARTATLPDGFRVEVFASEPEVRQPIAMCFDDGGRLWVAECYTFAERPLRWDMELRDRIVVFEDSNRDGKPDKRNVFWSEGTRLTSVAWGKGGVWALCAPQLLFIPDADNDLVPDDDPVVVLNGFDAENIGHNVVNGLKWGPDGWLYGRHGITSTSLVGAPGTTEGERVTLNCSIWRYHPEEKTFEVFCDGGTNPWGHDWNSDGQLFYTNTVIGHLWHAIPGAYYERMFGAHLNRHVYETIEHTADHYHWDTGAEAWNDIRKGVTGSTSALGGGHAHMGCLIYNAGIWPEKYRGKLFTCNLHGRRVNMDILERQGVGYVAHHGEDFLLMEDPWFRGLDLLAGPDGQMWINDWSDTGECHDNDGIHRTSGRIYRVVYGEANRGEPNLERPQWLSERTQIQSLLESEEEARRAIGVRRLAESAPEDPRTWKTLNTIASTDPPGLVRLELAAALQRLPLEQRFPLARILTRVSTDADDRQQSLMIWYGLSEAVPEFPDKAVALANDSRLPRVTRLIARRLAEGLEESPGSIESLLSSATKADADLRSVVLKGVAAALEGWNQASAPNGWEEFVAAVEHDGMEETTEIVRDLSILFGDGRAREELLEIAQDAEAAAAARRSALSALLRQPDQELLPHLKKWITDKVLFEEAVRGLANYDEPGIAPLVIQFWKRNTTSREIAIDTLVSRRVYADDLLEAVSNGTIPREAISPFQARQIQSLGDESLSNRLRELWGEIRETPEEKKREIEKWKTLLTDEVIKNADPGRGKAVFSTHCGACHKLYGEGGEFGPDLTGSDRHNLDYLLGNIINPNDVVPADYRLTVFSLKDGRVVSGVIPEQNDRSITVRTPVETLTLDRKEVASRETMPISLMPEGLFRILDENAVRDLVAYLMTGKGDH